MDEVEEDHTDSDSSVDDIVAQITKAYPNAVVSVVKSTNNIGLEEVESPAFMATSFEISESHSPAEQEYETEIPNELPAAASSNSVDNSPNIEDETVVDDPDWQPNYDEDPPEPEDDEITDEVPTNSNDITLGQARKSRKIKFDSGPLEWFDAKNQSLREQGKAYSGWSMQKGKTGSRGTQREERKFGERCISEKCKKSKINKCGSISEDERKELFNNFWQTLTWDQKKLCFVSGNKVCQKRVHKKTSGGRKSRVKEKL